MSIGCLSFLKVICFKKKHSKKEENPLKAEGLTKVKEKDAENSVEEKKKTKPETITYHPTDWRFLSLVGSSNVSESDSGGSYAGASSSPMTNDFNKVKTFDLREVAKATAK
ncbi:Uncharacterized protein HA466_0005610 [Hirschfeldia incana]|nr:Uncharacterized protein HA466_0005610 [Hirschfeldia incana]